MDFLDKDSPIPLYYQLYTILLNQIQDKTLKPGDKIATDLSLVEKYNISRATVRQAISNLEQNGYVYREKSKGTFIKNYSNNVLYKERLKRFIAINSDEDLVDLTTKVLYCNIITPPTLIRKALCIDENEKVFYLRRIRSIGPDPNTFVEDFVPYKLCNGIETIDFTNHSLYDILDNQFGVIPMHAKRTFDSCFADTPEQINELKVHKNTPLLRCTSKVYDDNNKLIEYIHCLVKGKYTMFE